MHQAHNVVLSQFTNIQERLAEKLYFIFVAYNLQFSFHLHIRFLEKSKNTTNTRKTKLKTRKHTNGFKLIILHRNEFLIRSTEARTACRHVQNNIIFSQLYIFILTQQHQRIFSSIK